MGETRRSFVNDGCGCVVTFVIVTLLIIVLDINIWIDIDGVLIILAFVFVIGGTTGLVMRWIYRKIWNRQSRARGFEVLTHDPYDKNKP